MKKVRNKSLFCGEVKRGKSYFEEVRLIKRICISWYGLGYLLATPKVKCLLIESVRDFIDDCINNINGENA